MLKNKIILKSPDILGTETEGIYILCEILELEWVLIKIFEIRQLLGNGVCDSYIFSL